MTEKCKVCKEEYSPSCEWKQGRCPHHPPGVDFYQARFYILIQQIKSLFKRK
jgi:hypothetical protein